MAALGPEALTFPDKSAWSKVAGSSKLMEGKGLLGKRRKLQRRF